MAMDNDVLHDHLTGGTKKNVSSLLVATSTTTTSSICPEVHQQDDQNTRGVNPLSFETKEQDTISNSLNQLASPPSLRSVLVQSTLPPGEEKQVPQKTNSLTTSLDNDKGNNTSKLRFLLASALQLRRTNLSSVHNGTRTSDKIVLDPATRDYCIKVLANIISGQSAPPLRGAANKKSVSPPALENKRNQGMVLKLLMKKTRKGIPGSNFPKPNLLVKQVQKKNMKKMPMKSYQALWSNPHIKTVQGRKILLARRLAEMRVQIIDQSNSIRRMKGEDEQASTRD